jgi:hypothetical protein
MRSGALRRREVIALLGGAACAWPFSRVAAAAPSGGWTDVHLHVVGGPRPEFRQVVDQVVADMEMAHIGKAVLMQPPNPNAPTDYPAFAGELSRYPGRFRFLGGGALLNARLQKRPRGDGVTLAEKQDLTRTAEAIAEAGGAGFGEIAVLHLSLTRNHGFLQISPEHPLLLELASVAGRHGLVIDIHMDPMPGEGPSPTPAGLKVPPNPPTLMGNVPGFERLLAHDRNARIVWAHGGSDFTGNMSPSLIRRLMDTHPNLYMSLRPVPAALTVAGAVELKLHNTIMTGVGIVDEWLDLLNVHSDRFVLGSDTFVFPSTMPPASPVYTLSRGNQARWMGANQLLARLPPDLASKIAQENASRLYRL